MPNDIKRDDLVYYQIGTRLGFPDVRVLGDASASALQKDPATANSVATMRVTWTEPQSGAANQGRGRQCTCACTCHTAKDAVTTWEQYRRGRVTAYQIVAGDFVAKADSVAPPATAVASAQDLPGATTSTSVTTTRSSWATASARLTLVLFVASVTLAAAGTARRLSQASDDVQQLLSQARPTNSLILATGGTHGDPEATIQANIGVESANDQYARPVEPATTGITTALPIYYGSQPARVRDADFYRW